MGLADAIHSAELDEAAIRDAAMAVGEAEGDVAVERALMLQAVMEILTPEQRAQARDMMDEHRTRMGKSGPRGWHRHGHQGPGPYGGPGRNIDD
jgi:Spy/CpxP family protein refolding chaperone